MLSAVLDRDSIKTLSWSLGIDVSYIEIDPKLTITQEKLDEVEKICNEAIAAATPVTVHVINDINVVDIPAEVSNLKSHLLRAQCNDLNSISDKSSNERFAKGSCR